MKQTYTITSNRRAADGIFVMELTGDISNITTPGQFVDIALESRYLRRPFSVFDLGADAFRIAYKVVGGGTKAMGALQPGQTVEALTGLGNGFDITKAGERPLLIGGGIGIAPLYLLGKQLVDAGKAVSVVAGFNTAGEDYCTALFRELGASVEITTADGSAGTPGFVTDANSVNCDYSFIYCCGPTAMMKAVAARIPLPGQFSLEERMGCGFGACLGCSIETKLGARRVCKDGPVFDKEVILW